jgi:glucose/arabinose dehydrogenase
VGPRILATGLLAVILVTAACSDADPSTPTAASEATTTAPAAESDRTVADDTVVDPTEMPQMSTAPLAVARPLTELSFELELLGTFEQPLDMAVRPGDPTLYVAEKTGRVRRVADGVSDPTPFLDLSDRVSTGGERGLLGITFTPDGTRLVASFTDRSGTSTIASWPADDGSIDVAAERVHLRVEQPFSNHNGGGVVYGPEGHLYVGLGDGGSGGDPLGSGQDTTTLLGSILRIDLTDDGHVPAPGNPLTAPDRPELWLWGLRNPWRFSFDHATGDLWIGDVGQGNVEEIDVVPADPPVRNLGWNRYEGSRRYQGDPLDTHVAPLVEYDHSEGVSVTGGRVYRGAAQPELTGAYFYGDYGGRWVRALRRSPSGDVAESVEALSDVGGIVGFGEDATGELYVITLEGPVYRIVAH